MKWLGIVLGGLLAAGCATTPGVFDEAPASVAGLKEVSLPAVQIQNEALSDVLQSIARGTGCNCHSAYHPVQVIQGDAVVYTLRHCSNSPRDPETPPCVLESSALPELVRLGPAISVRMGEASLYDLLLKVVEQAHAKMEIRPDAIVIRTRKIDPPAAP